MENVKLFVANMGSVALLLFIRLEEQTAQAAQMTKRQHQQIQVRVRFPIVAAPLGPTQAAAAERHVSSQIALALLVKSALLV